MGTREIVTFSRPLKYSYEKVTLPDGTSSRVPVPREKGIDIRIALDVVRYALEQVYDIALIFSQDQDLSEVAKDIKGISSYQGRWIKCACAFPVGPVSQNTRGINYTEWIKLDKTFYDDCIDQFDYRPGFKKKQLTFPIDSGS